MGEKKLAIYLGTVLFLVAAYLIRLNFQENPQVIPKNQNVTLVATVSTQPRLSARHQVIEIGDSRLFAPLYPKYTVGDRLKVEGFVDESGRIFNAKLEKVGGSASILGTVASVRQKIAANIDKLLPPSEATLVKGMVLGVDEIGRGLREALIATGTIHVVVVSGQNLSIVAGIFVGLVKYVGKRQSLTLATLAVFLYALLTGFEPPVVRALLMVLAGTSAVFLGRQSWPILNLILAALLILFIWPKALFEISFQLTFAATLGIMTVGAWIQRFFARGPVSSLFINNAAIATSAYLFTTPIIWWHFERISLVAPLANTLVAELVAPLMILGFLVAGASLVFMPIAQVLAYLAYVPAFVFIKAVELFAAIS
ncbi:MAG: ComEC/Rec2 family competence protein [Patescibacteria group bacterium]